MTIPKFLGSDHAGNKPPLAKLGVRELAFNMADGKIYTSDGVKIIELAPGKGDANVQSDWNQANTHSDDYIKNKPNIVTNPPQVNADWTEKATTSKAFIKNKPTIPVPQPAQVQSDWDEKTATSKAFIKNKPSIPSAPNLSKYVKSDVALVPSSAQVINMVSLSQHDYDAIAKPDAKTLYIIV